MIIQTLLDNDLYQFTMSQYAWQYHRDWRVNYKFRNRTFEVPLAQCLDLGQLRQEISSLSLLRFTTEDIAYLHTLSFFSDDFIRALADWGTGGDEWIEFTLDEDNGHLVLTYEGPWWQAVFFETPVLAIINELYFRNFHIDLTEGLRRLASKWEYLEEHPELCFSEFGTRRRFSREWQQNLVNHTANTIALPNLVGTSNVALAREFLLTPTGTMAHQLFMCETAKAVAEYDDQPATCAQPLAEGQWRVLDHWAELYRAYPQLLTVLPDTYSSRYFFQNIGWGQYEHIHAYRQDSGDPVEFGNYALEKFDPQNEKKLFFSDSLDLRQMSMLYDHFGERANVGFGWGTNLTNDVGLETLSIVIKPDELILPDGTRLHCVKLSDDWRKATGDPATVDKYKQLLVAGAWR